MSCEPQFFGHIKVNCYSSISALIWNFWHILKQSLQTIIFSTTTIGIGHFFDPSWPNKRLIWTIKRLILFSYKIIIEKWLKTLLYILIEHQMDQAILFRAHWILLFFPIFGSKQVCLHFITIKHNCFNNNYWVRAYFWSVMTKQKAHMSPKKSCSTPTTWKWCLYVMWP